MAGIDTILFDWDGTLIDTASCSFAAFQRAFHDLGIPIESELYEKIYSPNWYSMYRALQLPEDKWQEAEDLWLHHYAHMSAPLVPEGLHVLTRLHSRGYCLGIVTSGNRERVLRELTGFGLSDVFSTVVCNEDVFHKKPHPEGLIVALERLEKRPQYCCYVGDSPEDIEMGRRAWVQTIGIPGGYPGSKTLPTANPDFCFSSISQLLAHFGPIDPECAGIPGF
jgi:HAD superfamily hydrolase (TIGR01509 family)